MSPKVFLIPHNSKCMGTNYPRPHYRPNTDMIYSHAIIWNQLLHTLGQTNPRVNSNITFNDVISPRTDHHKERLASRVTSWRQLISSCWRYQICPVLGTVMSLHLHHYTICIESLRSVPESEGRQAIGYCRFFISLPPYRCFLVPGILVRGWSKASRDITTMNSPLLLITTPFPFIRPYSEVYCLLQYSSNILHVSEL